MNDLMEFIYFKKRKNEIFKNTLPSSREKEALENFDDTLTEEQRKLFREYERLLNIRIESFHKEIFYCGFQAGVNEKVELLQAYLKR